MLEVSCRLCGRQRICEQSKKLFDLENKKLLRHLFLITGLKLEVLPNAPESMCLCCQSDLRSALAFRKLCIKVQKRWNPSVTEISGWSDSDTEIETQQEKKREHLQTKTNRESDDDIRMPQKMYQILIEEDNSDNLLICDSAGEEEPFDTLKRTVVEAPPPESVQRERHRNRLKSKPEDLVYICEMCGVHATSKPVFERHMRKHSGERPFACEECAARFLSAAELRAHLRVHTKEQPFACRFCERKYVSYMGRLKHERIHTNERPFVCAECGQTFTNAYILKNHMLIHSGERRFQCDLCNRSFQRKTHMVTHFRSRLHKRKAEEDQKNKIRVIPQEL
ncbi:transcription factor Ouib [Drosophila serrata]|uniref:transcription factor Ouib n=1 Tax=Drosophila serrata TaxID=7274 RepID=UPI000A1CFDB8|nr:transcription factor Ouib [Drosophila serrata]